MAYGTLRHLKKIYNEELQDIRKRLYDNLENLIARAGRLKEIVSSGGREGIRAEHILETMYSMAEWYSLRYEAGVALKKYRDVLSHDSFDWICSLKCDFNEKGMSCLLLTDEGKYFRRDDINWRREHEKAKIDLEYLYHNLPFKEHREYIGEILNYSFLRIWVHEKELSLKKLF